MALYHRATLTPSKAEFLATWVPTQPWCPPGGEPIEVIGAYRFDDPEGRVGMEAHLVNCGDTVLHVPLTYRDSPMNDAEAPAIGEMDHSALGTRWIYDGFGDPRFIVMLAAASLTGQGEALGMVVYDGAWFIAPTHVRLQGGGWTQERVSVDGFVEIGTDETSIAYRNEGFDMTAHRHVRAGEQPPIGLTATWSGEAKPQVLTVITQR